MTEIVLKDLASIYLLKNCKAISLRGKIKVCYPNDILNLNACICSGKIRIRKTVVGFYPNAKLFIYHPYI